MAEIQACSRHPVTGRGQGEGGKPTVVVFLQLPPARLGLISDRSILSGPCPSSPVPVHPHQACLGILVPTPSLPGSRVPGPLTVAPFPPDQFLIPVYGGSSALSPAPLHSARPAPSQPVRFLPGPHLLRPPYPKLTRSRSTRPSLVQVYRSTPSLIHVWGPGLPVHPVCPALSLARVNRSPPVPPARPRCLRTW